MEQEDALIILDDGKARRFAQGLGLAYTGTLGIIAKARRMGLDVDMKSVIDEFKRAGFRMPVDIEGVLLGEDKT